jgi:hypothetical protein
MTITPRHSDITALLTATFMVRIFLIHFSSLLTMNAYRRNIAVSFVGFPKSAEVSGIINLKIFLWDIRKL